MSMILTCSTCNLEKDSIYYYSRKDSSRGFRRSCKDCMHKKRKGLLILFNNVIVPINNIAYGITPLIYDAYYYNAYTNPNNDYFKWYDMRVSYTTTTT